MHPSGDNNIREHIKSSEGQIFQVPREVPPSSKQARESEYSLCAWTKMQRWAPRGSQA